MTFLWVFLEGIAESVDRRVLNLQEKKPAERRINGDKREEEVYSWMRKVNNRLRPGQSEAEWMTKRVNIQCPRLEKGWERIPG